MSGVLSQAVGMIFIVGISMLPLFFVHRAKTDSALAVKISVFTFVVGLPLLYVGTFLQAPPEAIEAPVSYLLRGVAFWTGNVVAGQVLWQTAIMRRYKKNG